MFQLIGCLVVGILGVVALLVIFGGLAIIGELLGM